MLSRHADSCYWIGRSVERAEATARMVDVHYHSGLESFLPLVMDEDWTEESPLLPWHSVLAISGGASQYAERYGQPNERDMLYFFAFDPDNPNSILSVWRSARENARSIRDEISSEMWEALNIAYLRLQDWTIDRLTIQSPHEFFLTVVNDSHLFQGVLNRTLSMGEARDWIDAGRFLERGDQTARMLDVRYHDILAPRGDAALAQPGLDVPQEPLDTHAWIAVLKSVCAFEMYRKAHREGIVPIKVVDFLVLDPQFPASVRHCVERVEGCLHRISGTPRDGEATNEAERLIGRLRSDLRYLQAEEIVASGLHSFLSGVERRVVALGDAISRTYLS